MPNAVLTDPACSVDSKMYQDLIAMEKKLDWTMLRKKAEVSDALGKQVTVRAVYLLVASAYSQFREPDHTDVAHILVAYCFRSNVADWRCSIVGITELRDRERDSCVAT